MQVRHTQTAFRKARREKCKLCWLWLAQGALEHVLSDMASIIQPKTPQQVGPARMPPPPSPPSETDGPSQVRPTPSWSIPTFPPRVCYFPSTPIITASYLDFFLLLSIFYFLSPFKIFCLFLSFFCSHFVLFISIFLKIHT